MDNPHKRLIDECLRIQENSLWTATSHFNAAIWAGRIQGVAGAIPIILGGIGGWRFLSDPTVATEENMFFAGLMIMAAGIVGSLLSYWNLAKVRLEHFAVATKYKTLENKARRAQQIHARDEDYDAFKDRVMDLVKQYDELGESSAQSFDFAFWLARKKIQKGIFTTEVDTKASALKDGD